MTSNYSKKFFLFLLKFMLLFNKTIQTDDTTSKIQVVMMPCDWPVDDELQDEVRATAPSKSCTQNIKTKGLYMTLWLHRNKQGNYSAKNEVVIVNQVYDVVTEKIRKLLNPYVIVVKQDEVLESYKLKLLKTINAEVTEKVFNKESPNYSGCYSDPERSCCNAMKDKAFSQIPFSYGFCCSCKRSININRQLNDDRKKPHFFRFGHTTKNLESAFGQSANTIFFNESSKVNEDKLTNLLKQPRGGQNCNDSLTPEYVEEPYRYHESSHCLQFSDLWYKVYKLEPATYYHSATVSVYEKQMFNGKTSWKTILSKAKLSTKDISYKKYGSTVHAKHMGLTLCDNQYFSLDKDRDRLMTPMKVSPVVEHLYPQASDDPNKYLVLDSKYIGLNGDECDKAGVSYEAFYNQPDRCEKPRSSCLQNQPAQLWRRDFEAMKMGKPGNSFLKNFAQLPKDIEALQKENETETLNLLYEMDYVSEIMIRVEMEYQYVLDSRPHLEIVEMYSDATKQNQFTIGIAVYNAGMITQSFSVHLTDCLLTLETDGPAVQTGLIELPPFIRHDWTIRLYGSLLKSNTKCIVQIMDNLNQTVASRSIIIRDVNRCFCVWQCECACSTIEQQLFIPNCKKMNKEQYNNAGFRGEPPPNLQRTKTTMNYVQMILICNLIIWLLIIIIGTIKALFGLINKKLSSAGLYIIYHKKSKNLKMYMEPDLHSNVIVCDDEGYAVHPCSKSRYIQLVSRQIEFVTNLFYPALWFGSIVKQFFCRRNHDDDCKRIRCFKKSYDGASLKTDDDNVMTSESSESNQYDRYEKLIEELNNCCTSDDSSGLSLVTSHLLGNDHCQMQDYLDALLNSDIVYYNSSTILDGQNIPFSVAGHFINRQSNYYFYPTPLDQTHCINGLQLDTPSKLPPSQYNNIYVSKEDVLRNKELSLTPRGVIINMIA